MQYNGHGEWEKFGKSSPCEPTHEVWAPCRVLLTLKHQYMMLLSMHINEIPLNPSPDHAYSFDIILLRKIMILTL